MSDVSREDLQVAADVVRYFADRPTTCLGEHFGPQIAEALQRVADAAREWRDIPTIDAESSETPNADASCAKLLPFLW